MLKEQEKLSKGKFAGWGQASKDLERPTLVHHRYVSGCCCPTRHLYTQPVLGGSPSRGLPQQSGQCTSALPPPGSCL